MSSVPGPIIRFLVDQPGLSAAVQPAMRQLKDDAQRASRQIAESWRTTAAQIRADMSRGVLSTKQLGDAQLGLVASLQGQISSLRQRNELSTKELSNLKAMTLELERQKNALKTGTGVGITRGTEVALNQVSTQTFLGITRTLDALVNRYFGGAAGSAFRTLRDTAYYSSMAGGAEGTKGGSGILGKLFSPAGLTTAGGVLGIAGAAAVITKMSLSGGKLAVELTNLSGKTGLTTDSVIKLRSATSVLDVDFDRVLTGFRKFDQEITLATAASLPNASQKAKEAAAIFQALGVDVKKAASDPFTAIQQLSRALSVLPDGAVKTAVAVQLFGRGGMELLPVLDRLTPALNATSKSSIDLAKALTGGAGKSMEDLKAQMTNFKNETDALEISLAQKVIPALAKFVGGINRTADALHRAWDIPTTSSGSSAESTGYGSLIRKPNLSSINTGFHVSVNMKSLGNAAEEAADKLRSIPGILGTTGKSARGARAHAGSVNPYERSLPGNYINWNPPFVAGPAPNMPIPSPGDVPLVGGMSLNQVVDQEKKTAEALSEANKQMAKAAEKLQEEIRRQTEQYKSQADSLFKELVSGNSKQFSKQLQSDVEDIVLKPFQAQFENIMVGLFGGLNKSINGGPAGSSGKRFSLGGIFGGLFGPGGTPGTFSGPLGIGKTTSTISVSAGQSVAKTQTMYVNAGVVNLGGTNIGGVGGGGIPGASGFLGGGNSFFGGSSIWGGGGSSTGTSGGIGGLWGGGAGSIIGGLLVGGLGASHGSATSEALGASSAAQGVVKALASGGHISAGLASSLTTGLGGVGLLASGIAQGGVGGIFSDVAGGAQLGTMINPIIGPAIGAALGAVVGGIRDIFGGKGWNYNVKKAMSQQAIYLPPSENFSFSSLPGSSISQTMGTGFGMVGNTGSSYALPSNTPFSANSIYGPLTKWQQQQLNQWETGLNPNEPFFGSGASPNAPGNPFTGNFSGWNGRAFPTQPNVSVHLNLPGFVDQSSVGPLIQQIAPMIAQHVSRQFNQASSGMGSAVRRATSLP